MSCFPFRFFVVKTDVQTALVPGGMVMGTTVVSTPQQFFIFEITSGSSPLFQMMNSWVIGSWPITAPKSCFGCPHSMIGAAKSVLATKRHKTNAGMTGRLNDRTIFFIANENNNSSEITHLQDQQSDSIITTCFL